MPLPTGLRPHMPPPNQHSHFGPAPSIVPSVFQILATTQFGVRFCHGRGRDCYWRRPKCSPRGGSPSKGPLYLRVDAAGFQAFFDCHRIRLRRGSHAESNTDNGTAPVRLDAQPLLHHNPVTSEGGENPDIRPVLATRNFPQSPLLFSFNWPSVCSGSD